MLHIQAFIVIKLRLVSIWRKSQKKKHFWMYSNFCISVWIKIIIILQKSCVDSIASCLNVRIFCFDMHIHIFLSMLLFFAYCNRAADFTSFLEDILPCLMNSFTQRFLTTSSVYVCGYLCGLCGNIGHEMLWLTRINNWNTTFHITGYQKNRDINIDWLIE